MSKRDSRPPTMNDVAELAGVSQTTVSFVINKRTDVNIPQETQDRVWAAVGELGYRANVLARSLRTQRSGLLGFITDEIAISPHAGKIFEGAQDVAWAHVKILLLINTKNDPDMIDAAIETLLERQVEGIIYATMYHRPVHPPENLHEVPTVLLDCYAEDRSFPSVVPAEVEGARNATQHLLKQGHRRIGFINHVDDIPATHGRLQGYKQALADFDIPFDEDLVRVCWAEQKGGYDQTIALMQMPDPPTALFYFNDRTAMGAYDALRKLNLSIPDDVAVIGFDNQKLISAHLHPSLTTMELPHYRMGEWAVNKLISLIEGEDHDPLVQHKIECPLIKRDSA
ncbi:MAG: LacI family DNA-binding transcriptional regulator [Anaerolineales bacterium]